MKDFVAEPYHMRLDLERTRTYYAAHPLPWITCGCAGCRNFIKAAANLPPIVTDFFHALGLDPLRPAETCHYYAADTDNVFSSAWYHVCGELMQGDPAPGSRERYGSPLELMDGVSFSAASDCDLLPDDFPTPCFQVEFWFNRLPWLLDEPNPYLS